MLLMPAVALREPCACVFAERGAVGDHPDAVDRVQESTRQAQSVGINAIPAFVLDRRLIVLGAQPLEAFRSAFAQLAT